MILGQHTVAETRDLMRVGEFRANNVVRQLQKIQVARPLPFTESQKQLDADTFNYMRRWTDVRDRQALLLAAAITSQPLVSPIILPAEVNFTAIDNAMRRDTPRLGDIENRLGVESAALSILPIDFSQVPPQNSPDADFATLHVLDAAIAKGEAAAAAAKNSVSSLPSKVGNGIVSAIPWWGWGIGGVVAVGAGYSFVKTGQKVAEKAERDTKYIHENLTSKVLPGYKG